MTRFVVALPWWLWLPGALVYALFWFYAVVLVALVFVAVLIVRLFADLFTWARRTPDE